MKTKKRQEKLTRGVGWKGGEKTPKDSGMYSFIGMMVKEQVLPCGREHKNSLLSVAIFFFFFTFFLCATAIFFFFYAAQTIAREKEKIKQFSSLLFHQRFARVQGRREFGVDIPAVSGAKAGSRPRTSWRFVAGPLWRHRNPCALSLTPTHGSETASGLMCSVWPVGGIYRGFFCSDT